MRNSLSDALASYRGVIFDLDGTLLDLPVDWEALRIQLREHWATLGMDSDTLGIREGLDAIQRQFGSVALAQSFKIIRRHEALAVDAAHPHLAIIDAAMVCAERGQYLAILSANMTETAHEALVYLDLTDAFGLVIGGDKFNHRKPHPEGLRAILENWRLCPEEVAYVADGDQEATMAAHFGVQLFQAA